MRRLLADGASVLASGWEPHDAEMTWGADPGGVSALLEELGGEGPHLAYQAADLERPEAATELVDATIERFGSIDLVIANHARSSSQGFAEVSDEAAWITGQVHDHEGGFRRWAGGGSSD